MKKITIVLLLTNICITLSGCNNNVLQSFLFPTDNVKTSKQESNIDSALSSKEKEKPTIIFVDDGGNEVSQEEASGNLNKEEVEEFKWEALDISDDLKMRMEGKSYPAKDVVASPEIDYKDLSYLKVKYWNFNNEETIGEIICNKKIAKDLLEIFEKLYEEKYQIEQIKLVDEYDGDDNRSITANNTSCFNYRTIAGSKKLSSHATGCAIDINPLYNPCVRGSKDEDIYPIKGKEYVDRNKNFEHKITHNDLCYKLFKEHGFEWGGDFNSIKDYQHFEKVK